jgi:DNA integrity scanning protein DisA with diadenylate cyclase activity
MTIAVLKKLCSAIPWCEPEILEQTVELALEIAREGREGRRIGTLFTLGAAEAVLAASRPLILDPLAGHAPARTHITDPDLRGTLKELAQLDGAFVISEAGTVVAACRYLDASAEGIDLPLGLGSRPLAGASISQRLGAIAIVVSESGVVAYSTVAKSKPRSSRNCGCWTATTPSSGGAAPTTPLAVWKC